MSTENLIVQKKQEFAKAVSQSQKAFLNVLGNEKGATEYKRELAFGFMAAQKNTRLLSDPQGLTNAIANVALTGLSLDPTLALAYLVPRNGKVVLDISYQGMITKLIATGSVLKIKAVCVFKDDPVFEWEEGTESYIKHTVNRERKAKDETPANLVAVYATWKLPNGEKDFVVMKPSDIFARMGESEGFKYAKSRGKGNTPWIKWFAEMCKKTGIRYAWKLIPKNPQHPYRTHL